MFGQLALCLPGTEPCACSFFFISDLQLLDIPSVALRHLPALRGGPHFQIVSTGINNFWQLALYVPGMKDELTRPLRGHPFSTRKGGALFHALLFPHMRFECVVQFVLPPHSLGALFE